MGGTRKIIFCYEDDHIYREFDFGTYVLMLYYAKQVNYEKAKLLYYATLPEYRYREIYKLPTGLLTDEDFECHFDISEFKQVVAFIENDLIPELNNEEHDLIEKYGGRDGFYNRFNKDSGFIQANIYDEYYESDPLLIAGMLEILKELLSNAIFTNKPYEVFLH
jgi:hypothetical protein